MQRKVVAQATRLSSFREARESIHETLEIKLTIKQIERVTERVGESLVDHRNTVVESWEKLPLMAKEQAPEGVIPPDLAAVVPDGGRLQLVDKHAETGKHWYEDKAGALLEMESEAGNTDPCPEVPDAILDVAWAEKISREMGKRAAAEAPRNSTANNDESESAVAQLTQAAGLREAEDEEYCESVTDVAVSRTAPVRRKPPKMLRKTVVATMRNSREFGTTLAAMSWGLGFFAASRRAYLGDGQGWIWAVFEERFKPFGFVGILDIVHVTSYVYGAAMARRSRKLGAKIYRRWITWVWQGRVQDVIDEVRKRQAELGPSNDGEGETSPRAIIAKSLTYFENQSLRMDYPSYRRQGLPITSAYIESTIKQLNKRVKGSEKFWSKRGAEALLHLKSEQISHPSRWERIWQRRGDKMNGQRVYAKVA